MLDTAPLKAKSAYYIQTTKTNVGSVTDFFPQQMNPSITVFRASEK